MPVRKGLLTARSSVDLCREQIQRWPVLAALSGEYEQAASKPRQDWLAEFWDPQAAGRGCQAAHGGLKAPIWAMIAATSSAAHSSLILPSVTR